MSARLTLLSLLALTAVGAQEAGELAALRQRRAELAHRPRRVIANNDGCDVLYYPKDAELTVPAFLDLRTTALADTQVDAISYCTISSGFGFFTHHTKVGEVLTRQGGDYGIQPKTRNITAELIAAGTDPLHAVLDYGHAQNMEVWWSMRMNDTHDAAWRPDAPYLLYPDLKLQHPDWLLGDPIKRTPHGRWSSVNYALPQIRELALGYLTEVAENYDVDALELDYFRHLSYFASVANGGVASDEERAAVTDLMRQIRTMTETVGLRRGRPLLVAIRVPDGVEFSRDLGLDIETWLREGLVDILITTCYFRLNPWSYSVDLGHRYNVAVYAGLSDSRVTGETRFHRKSIASYRGRAANAWAAGADGIYLFNYFNPKGPVFRELGDPQALQTMDKLYFATVRDGNPASWLAGGQRWQTTSLLNPAHAGAVRPDQPLQVPLTVSEDPAVSPAPTLTLHLELPTVTDPAPLVVTLNGHRLPAGTLTDGWLDLSVPRAALVRGDNQVAVALDPTAAVAPDAWGLNYTATKIPASPWTRDRGSAQTVAEVVDGALRIADEGTDPGDYLYYRAGWGIEPGQRWEAEAEVKVVSGGSYLIATDGQSGERIGLFPDHVELWSARDKRFDIDLTDRFHTVRVVCENQDLQVFVDGHLAIDAPGQWGARDAAGGSTLSFGAANSPELGEALWRTVRARPAVPIVRDLVLQVQYPQ